MGTVYQKAFMMKVQLFICFLLFALSSCENIKSENLIECTLCEQLMGIVEGMVQDGVPQEDILTEVDAICKGIFGWLGQDMVDFCSGLLGMEMTVIINGFINGYTTHEVCIELEMCP